MYKNAAVMHTTIRGGRNGYIGLLMDASFYANVATTAHTRPAETGQYAQHEPGDSAEELPDTNETHKEGRRIYDLDENVYAALKQEIITEVEDTYFSTKKTAVHGVSRNLFQEDLGSLDGEV